MPLQSVDDLGSPDQLLLLSCRRSMPGRAAGPCVELAWRLACGDRLGARASAAFVRMVALLHVRARRPLSFAQPHATGIAIDERSVLELVAACQCGAAGLARPLAAWLVKPPHEQALQAAAASLGVAMLRADLRLLDPVDLRADLTASA